MTQYVDGFLLPVLADRIDEYKKLATTAGQVWLEYGALAYWETQEDDLGTDQLRSFRVCADAKENEVVIFAWVVYASREDRDRILAAVMKDTRLCENTDMPFDMQRMAHAGFKPIVMFNK